MEKLTKDPEATSSRRSFLKKSMVAGAVATVGTGLLGSGLSKLTHASASPAMGTLRSFNS